MGRQRARSREAPAVSGAARLIVPRHSLGSSTGSNNSSSAQRRSISEKDTKSTASTPPQAPVPPPRARRCLGNRGRVSRCPPQTNATPEQQRRRHVQKRKLTVSKSPSSHPPDKVGRAQCRDGPPRLRRACTAKTFKVSRLQCVSLCVIHTCAKDGTIMRFKDA
ncbi:hypothetical protein TGDOM2_249425 [Toxoplasma gondii GAB2-2007-GAL-DOM2]|nr:hypothetical protein TGDOM2_249425 [Toxoplasma gondii GAB2-2007-GAL-DOM2]